jgi:RNA polymerase sigma-70 factor (TIGR02960 family)
MEADARAVGGGDGFAALAERHRSELHLHCYRMLASYEEAEDAVQDTLLRAWRGRDAFDGVGLRAWLYRIATNVCLDAGRRRARRPVDAASMADVPWLQPYPDLALDQISRAGGEEPETVAVERETIELLFLAALQLLPARQRAALIARDVLGWSAKETAALLGTTVAAANSALQRARATMQEHLPKRREEWRMEVANEEEMAVLARFVDAHQRCDATAALAIAAEDVRVTMPPLPYRFEGLAALAPLLERAFGENREGDWLLRPTRANRMPAAVSYLRRPGDSVFRAFKLDVLRVEAGRIREITTFGTALLPAFGLPLAI